MARGAKTLVETCAGIRHGAVSYTHLDVYKRQAGSPADPLGQEFCVFYDCP